MRDPIYATECEVIYTHAYVHVDISNTNTRACLERNANSTYHARTCPTTTHSCEQATYCAHVSVWSVELCTSTAAMCCAPSAPIEFLSRLYANVYMRRAIHVAHDARSSTYIQPRATSYTLMHTCMPTYLIQIRVDTLHVYLPTFIPVHNAIVYTMHTRAPLLRTHASRLCTALT
jgi:hypothetical protein